MGAGGRRPDPRQRFPRERAPGLRELLFYLQCVKSRPTEFSDQLEKPGREKAPVSSGAGSQARMGTERGTPTDSPTPLGAGAEAPTPGVGSLT